MAALDTYRYLRGGMAVMIVLLGAAVVAERVGADCWQTTISDYYYTSAHAVFIASVCAVGAMLIVYKGSNATEDVLLNFAGTLAFVVAMVPTTRPDLLCGPIRLSIGDDAAVRNVWAVVVALVVSRVASWWMYRRTGTTRERPPLANAATWLQRVVLGVGVVTLVAAPEWFRANAHGVAAVAMFASIIATVLITAFVTGNQDRAKCPQRRRYQAAYRVIAAAMALALGTAVVLHLVLDGFNHAIIVIEAALILLFGVYWLVQTVELWGTTTRAQLMPDVVARRSRILQAL
ncbi:hypothetical protein [Mycolicibacterium lacusdiani]|uniref:hypothetical protein n=1 Tax=Mycolicibacterium lacusdiani TaxID=2895283 RepID=UPI001F1877AC|nr:hypothetical protein [Mycolicibacterium lacusdiani]